MNKEEIVKSLEKIYSESTDSHNIYTPLELCEEMINSLTKLEGDILVISNLEFLIVLKSKINLDNVHYSTSCDIKKQVAISLGLKVNNIHFLEYNNKEINLGIEKNMKFDIIVMNPPYGKGNPELKFLKKVYEICNFENNGTVLSIQPLRWLEDPLWKIKNSSKAKKLEEFFSGKLEVVRELISNNGNNGFDARFNMNLAIFKLSNYTTYKYDNYIDYTMFNIIEKIKNKCKTINDVLDKKAIDGIRVNLQFITACQTGSDQYKNRCIWIDGMDDNNNYWCSKTYIKNQYFKPDGTPLPFSIKFNSILEAENFVDFLKNSELYDAITKWYKADVHIRFTEIPFMCDYTKKWNFKELCDYFNFSQDEINTLNYHLNKDKRYF